jgi:phosphatidylserine decarboxylase
MTVKGLIAAFTQQEDLNFLLTNRIPRAALTRFMGWFSRIENPMVRDLSIACWRQCGSTGGLSDFRSTYILSS